jgi:cellulose synthase/poly-beta-1,6-N-acetylglucosamine synthase-like glycosyltransferase
MDGSLEITPKILVGICAYNEERRIGSCLERVLDGHHSFHILVIASGCTDSTADVVKRIACMDQRVELVEEGTRNGKAKALGEILRRFASEKYDWLVILSADSKPSKDAVHRLVSYADLNNLDVCSGMPLADDRGEPRLIKRAASLLWKIHNNFISCASSRLLPHCTDELLCVRKGVLNGIPPDVVNDGAYISVVAKTHGLKVGFCSSAVTLTSVPKNLAELTKQRARILLGHILLRKRTGYWSNTVESSLLNSPSLSFSALRKSIRERPDILAFTMLLIVECQAMLLAFGWYIKRGKPWIWRKVVTE